MCSCLELNSWCGSGSQLEKAQKPALFSFIFDYVTGNRSENGTCGFKLPGFSPNADFLAGWEISREPVDVTLEKSNLTWRSIQ